MSKESITSSSSSGGIGIIGLVILFWNFDNNNFDLYDMIIKALGG